MEVTVWLGWFFSVVGLGIILQQETKGRGRPEGNEAEN